MEASGVVRFTGKPIANASVMMEPRSGGPVASGGTDTEGRFFMSVANRRGLPPGRYRAAVTLFVVEGVDPNKVGDFTSAKLRWIVPQRFSRPETSGLEVDLDRDRTDLVFDLQP